jgi:hypothetical protein
MRNFDKATAVVASFSVFYDWESKIYWHYLMLLPKENPHHSWK